MILAIPMYTGTAVAAFWAFRVGFGYPIMHILHQNVVMAYLFFLLFYMALIVPALGAF